MIRSYIFLFESKRQVAKVNLIEDLQRIAAWCCAHSLLINLDKTKLLLLGTPQMLARVPEGFAVSLLGKEISPSLSAKSLGLVLDSHLRFDEHVTDLVSKCTGSLCQLNRVKHLFDRSTLITIINALVFSKLIYCSSVWAGVTKKNIERLQKVQNFAVRIVTGTHKFEHITPYLKDLRWLPLAMQLEVRDTIMTYKSLNGLTLRNFLTTRSEIYEGNTRNKDKLHVPLYRTTTAERSFKYRGTSLWNSLPKEIRDISSLDSFEKQIMNRAFYKFLENN